jgi:hypothetical protein
MPVPVKYLADHCAFCGKDGADITPAAVMPPGSDHTQTGVDIPYIDITIVLIWYQQLIKLIFQINYRLS